jgi:hypothetical protein
VGTSLELEGINGARCAAEFRPGLARFGAGFGPANRVICARSRGSGRGKLLPSLPRPVIRATELLPFELNSHAWSALSRRFSELVDAQAWRPWTLLWIMTKLALFADQSLSRPIMAASQNFDETANGIDALVDGKPYVQREPACLFRSVD